MQVEGPKKREINRVFELLEILQYSSASSLCLSCSSNTCSWPNSKYKDINEILYHPSIHVYQGWGRASLGPSQVPHKTATETSRIIEQRCCTATDKWVYMLKRQPCDECFSKVQKLGT